MAVDAVVMGLGYVGMPLVHAAVHAGLTVIGFDVSDAVVDGLTAGRSHIDDLSDAQIAEIRDRGFRATSDESVLAEAGYAFSSAWKPRQYSPVDMGRSLGEIPSRMNQEFTVSQEKRLKLLPSRKSSKARQPSIPT